jgi:hypothetical protein
MHGNVFSVNPLLRLSTATVKEEENTSTTRWLSHKR